MINMINFQSHKKLLTITYTTLFEHKHAGYRDCSESVSFAEKTSVLNSINSRGFSLARPI